MKFKIIGGGQVNLSKRDFVGSGGEGSVYVRGDTAYKIYADPKGMIPEGKIMELSGIVHRNVIRPQNILASSRNKPVGYTMRFVKGGMPICQLFTKSFKKRNSIEPRNILSIVQDMQNGLNSIHDADVLVVDLNEMNLLVKDSEVYWIDVDSYETPHYPATAIMDSIRDWRANGKWSKDTDWFSWGVVTFQLFTGIHPYKGKHASVKKMSDRMLQNLSVFNGQVNVPKMVPNFDVIPEAYRGWYRAVFEDGARVPPPKDLKAIVVVAAPRHISSTDKIEIAELMSFDDDIVRYESIGGMDLVEMGRSVVCLKGGKGTPVECKGDGFFGHMGDMTPLYARFDRKQASVINLRTGVDVGAVQASSLMSYEGRFYTHFDDHVNELVMVKFGNDITISKQTVANVMPRATSLFDGVAIQNMLGTWYASVFPGSRRSHQARLSELDGYRIVDAKHDRRVLIVVGTKNGKYDKFVYRFGRDYVRAVLFWKDEDVAYSGVNFVTLDNGICAHIDEVEDLVLFPSSPSDNGVKRISDPMLGGDMILFRRGNSVLFARGKQVFKLSTVK